MIKKIKLSFSVSGIILILIILNMGIFGFGVMSSEELKTYKKNVTDIHSDTAINKYQIALRSSHDALGSLSAEFGLNKEIKPKILKSKSLAQIRH